MNADPSARFAELRAGHPELVYESFAIAEGADAVEFTFTFALANGPTFRPTLRLPRRPDFVVERELLENLAFHIGLVEAISYWKAACPPVVRIRAGSLDAGQQGWWENLWRHGLGEFFYRNGLAPGADFVRFATEGPARRAWPCAVEDRNLIPIGGGKDSLVTLGLLEPFHEKNLCFLLNRSRAQEESARLFGYGPERTVVARRTIDPALLELNRQGYWNGHTPFSALLGFTAVAAAVLQGASRVVLSNESSASEPTVPGTEVNHQYSKSWAFEQAFSSYVAEHLTPSVAYFSLLRPWNELRIARRFAADGRGLAVFRSCNVGARDDRWCGACPKCLFVDILLAPFVPRGKRVAVFGIPPLERPELRPLLDELAGIAPVKPFECVGTVEEVRAALTLAANRPDRPELARYFAESHPGLRVTSERIEALLGEFGADHHVPVEFVAVLR